MGEHIMWAVLLKGCGQELARVALRGSPVREELPLRALASEGLRHHAAGMVVIRCAADESCRPGAQELNAIGIARRTLGAIGLTLHDYILWHGDICASLRDAGLL
jgi:hypothetical protein